MRARGRPFPPRCWTSGSAGRRRRTWCWTPREPWAKTKKAVPASSSTREQREHQEHRGAISWSAVFWFELPPSPTLLPESCLGAVAKANCLIGTSATLARRCRIWKTAKPFRSEPLCEWQRLTGTIWKNQIWSSKSTLKVMDKDRTPATMVVTLGSTLVRSSIIFSRSPSIPLSILYTESSIRAATLLYVSWTQSTSAKAFACHQTIYCTRETCFARDSCFPNFDRCCQQCYFAELGAHSTERACPLHTSRYAYKRGNIRRLPPAW